MVIQETLQENTLLSYYVCYFNCDIHKLHKPLSKKKKSDICITLKKKKNTYRQELKNCITDIQQKMSHQAHHKVPEQQGQLALLLFLIQICHQTVKRSLV